MINLYNFDDIMIYICTEIKLIYICIQYCEDGTMILVQTDGFPILLFLHVLKSAFVLCMFLVCMNSKQLNLVYKYVLLLLKLFFVLTI